MEVKVWVEGLPKTICGVSSTTTCQDIVCALAYATGKRGRFILFERWGKTEKPLSPSDHLSALLLQKGEYRHDVQFILRKTDSISTNQSPAESLSPLPGQPLEPSPFQRGRNGILGNLRKSVTSHGSHWVPPKVIRFQLDLDTKDTSIVDSDFIPSSVKENNFPTDLMGIHYGAKESVPGNNLSTAPGEVSKLTVGSNSKDGPKTVVSKQPVVLKHPSFAEPVPSANGSVDMHSSRSVLTRVSKTSKEASAKCVGPSRKKDDDRRKQLLSEILLQEDQLMRAKADSSYYDKEVVEWESRTSKIALEVETMEKCIQGLRTTEKVVVKEVEELSNLSLEHMVAGVLQAEKKLSDELRHLQTKVTSCEENIEKCRNQARHVHEELQAERVEQEKQRRFTESSLQDERDRLMKELKELAQLEENQNKRLEEIIVCEQRLDSTLLAKQLELDSLQNSLKKANFEGFLEGRTAKSPSSPDSLSNGQVLGTKQEVFKFTEREKVQSSPSLPVRKSLNSQRILVLKRNIARDPQGMWV